VDNYLSVIDTIYAVVDYAKGEGYFLNIINTIVDSSVLRRLATDKKQHISMEKRQDLIHILCILMKV
jgi:hypothetical protein